MGKIHGNIVTGKRRFYLNMEDIADADCAHTKRVCKDFEILRIRDIGEYYDLYVQNDTLLFADVLYK